MIFSDPHQKSEPPTICYEFGPFHLNPVRRLLMQAGVRLPLTSKAFDTLLVLLENRHRVVEKETLLMRVWGGRLVAENNLNQKIAQLRRVLCDHPRNHQYIVTIPGSGYQFVATVREIHCNEDILPGSQQKFSDVTETFQAQRRTIAVLPFGVLGTEEHEYLGLCLADALITRLSKLDLPGLVVIPATNTLSTQADEIRSYGKRKKPGVSFMLTGRIRKSGHRIRITAQFMGVDEGVTLWADQFDETLTDWLFLEDKIARQITEALYLKIKRGQFDPFPEGLNKQPGSALNEAADPIGQTDARQNK